MSRTRRALTAPAAAASRTEVIGGIEVELVEKRVKRLSLRVYPPDGRVRLTVPRGTSRSVVWQTVLDRTEWIRGHQRRFRALPQPETTDYVSGETHYVAGEPKLLQLRTGARKGVELTSDTLLLYATPACGPADREARLDEWYRRRLQNELPELVARWAQELGVPPPETRVKRMRTRWGSCNPRARRIWLNLALARRRPELLEYVVVHELAHLLVADHGPRFKALMSRHLPHWRQLDAELDEWPIWAPRPAPPATSR